MKPSTYRRAGLGLLALSVVGLISGCGGNNPYGDALSISVTPSSQALIGPGPIASCVDEATYKAALASATGYTAMTYSVSGKAILFNNFELKWNSPDTLYVQELRITVTGAGLSTSPMVISLQPQEIEALLAVSGAIINPPVDQGGSATPPATTTIESSDGTSRTSGAFAACGLAVGGLTVKNGTSTPQFIAQVTIEVIGTAVDSSQNERFVSYQIMTTAHYFGG